MEHVLILGGTAWLGREIARQAVEAGDDVTCLARGVAGDQADGARLVRADRTAVDAYAEVSDNEWDIVVDVAWQPGMVREAVQALGERASHWTYVSSISAYRDETPAGQDEDAALAEPWASDEATMLEYSQAKAACEAYVRNALGERSLIARPGLIGGPGDPSDRFGYWPAALARAHGGPVLVPANVDQLTQTIDVRDLAGWLLTAARARLSGPVNVVGESARLGALWDLCAEASESPARWEPASEAFLLDQGVEPWSGPRSLPMWLPAADSGFFGATPDGRALRAALQRRPLVNTIVDVLADERDRGLDRPRRAGLTRPEESALLALLTA